MALLIFDLDGTLLDSIEGIGTASNKALAQFGYPPHPIEAYKHYVGNGLRMTIERALPSEAVDRTDEVLEVMIEIYKKDYVIGLKPYEGIYTMLKDLISHGHQIAMITNKLQFMADVIMPEFFADYPFIETIGRNATNPAKPDPTTILRVVAKSGMAKEESFMIGDTEADIEAARNAGIKEVYVSWGFRKPEEVAYLKPKVSIDKPLDLLNIFKAANNELI